MSEHKNSQVIRDLIDRLSRLNAAEDWNGPLNPSQFAALSYLARANRFSRAPSHVAEYLVTTRGTASQTLKALARKGLICESRSETDKRSIRYDVTDLGKDMMKAPSGLANVIDDLPDEIVNGLTGSLKTLVREILKTRKGRSFGLCRTCAHHRKRGNEAYCKLLDVPLAPADANEICHEHIAA
ncbi:MarR family winged helix-turn-helix transcriptional regulator [Roseibium album]|uniref:MarR family protein n=1 Tax=Roseibium album TaxID=311410 RepID=A0A0M7ARZ9_9HYPH|nr:MarR family transcriptional regulator [Roseibium album]MBG6208458.1 DNA-binding MarR family transcriptional regulator [Labrenzia sp. EL_126]CTQ60077.1 MarR family protein [Roseibium album]CTQ77281.1 MarR family protein [Roseibium album]CTQ77543.1 MarR family protein [Roseibium album]